MNRLILLTLILICHASFSCDSPPDSQATPPDELISRTSQIALAKVVSASASKNSYEVSYRFKTIKMLKGKAVKHFEILGHPLYEGGLRNFDHHMSEEFWKNYGGRLSSYTDCEIHPGFFVGGIYLVFLNEPYHNKSFESVFRINGDSETKDKWLFYVEEKLKP